MYCVQMTLLSPFALSSAGSRRVCVIIVGETGDEDCHQMKPQPQIIIVSIGAQYQIQSAVIQTLYCFLEGNHHIRRCMASDPWQAARNMYQEVSCCITIDRPWARVEAASRQAFLYEQQADLHAFVSFRASEETYRTQKQFVLNSLPYSHGRYSGTSHQWLICTEVCSATIAAYRHARRVGSLRAQLQSQLKSRDGKCPGLRRNISKATMWRLMTLHLRLHKLANKCLDLQRLFGAFGIAVGACICGIPSGYQSNWCARSS
jgi:hypothetical protein